MAQWLGVLTVLPENLSSVLSIQTKRLTAVSNSSSKGSDTILWCPWALHSHVHEHVHTQHTTHTHRRKFWHLRVIGTWPYVVWHSRGMFN